MSEPLDSLVVHDVSCAPIDSRAIDNAAKHDFLRQRGVFGRVVDLTSNPCDHIRFEAIGKLIAYATELCASFLVHDLKGEPLGGRVIEDAADADNFGFHA